MAIDKHVNTLWGSGIPLIVGDCYRGQDHIRDILYAWDLAGRIVQKALGTFPVLLSGGLVTQGSGDTLNITPASGLVSYDVSIPNDWTVVPPAELAAVMTRLVQSIQQTNLAIASATLNGVATNYVKLRYAETNGNTRQRAKAAGVYAYELVPSFTIVVNTTVPTDYDIVLATFVGNTGGTFAITQRISEDVTKKIKVWVANTSYGVNDVVQSSYGLFKCIVAHVSIYDEYTDIQSTDWDMIFEITVPSFDDSASYTSGKAFSTVINNIMKCMKSGKMFTGKTIVSTYALAYTVANAYHGGVLAPDGTIHFVPENAVVGQKISPAGVVSTYALAYTTTNVYRGGVLAPDGTIHFVPYGAIVGQKISPAGVVSTYALVYTSVNAYSGGVLAPDGTIHFVPQNAPVGQKISPAGVVSTYALAYTTTNAYHGGVLAPDGTIHFVPHSAIVGQKISPAGVVSTYALVYTTTTAYQGGVLAPDGTIHFVAYSASVGQKISPAGVVSTYALVYTSGNSHAGGVLAPDGTIHFVPHDIAVSCGQKISPDGVVSTYALVYTVGGESHGGVLAPDGTIHFVPSNATRGQAIISQQNRNPSKMICCHPFFNKL